jgi:hypothetical protein
METPTLSLVVSAVALFISALTAWLTLLRRGTVRMTRPTVIYFGGDGGVQSDTRAVQKVYLRALLFATSKRGRIVESMFVRLRRGETSQNFNVWVYGEQSLARGSGLFVGENGICANHHFLLPEDGTRFEFLPGTYEIGVYATLAGGRSTLRLFHDRLEVTPELSTGLKEPRHGLYFDWGADSGRYHPHVRKSPEKLDLGRIFEQLSG